MNITIAGLGYVGLSLSVLLAQYHDATAVDGVAEKVRLVQWHRFCHRGTCFCKLDTYATCYCTKASV